LTLAALPRITPPLRRSLVVGSVGATRVANLPRIIGAVGRASEAVAGFGVAAIGGGLVGPLLDAVILAASSSPATAAAATTPTASTVAVHLATALGFAFARFAGVAAEFARRLASGDRPLFIASARRTVVVASAWWSVIIAAWRSIVIAAAWRSLGPCARVIIHTTWAFAAALAFSRLVGGPGLSGGRFRCWPRSGAWRGPRFGRTTHS
jgi:hypothetical protein